jgi:hypothetical protein
MFRAISPPTCGATNPMQPQPAAANPTPLPLDQPTLAVLIQATLDALPHHPSATPDEIATIRQSAVTAIATLRPRDPMEAILAARFVATHHAAMDCLRCASQPGLPLHLKLRCLGKFASLSRLADATRQALTDAQARPAREPATVPAPIPAARPLPAAAQPTAHAKPRQAQSDDSPSAAAPRLPIPANHAPHSAIAAPPAPGDAVAQRVLDQIAARSATAPAARAA